MEIPLKHFVDVLDQIVESPRWEDQDTPMPGRITELGERIKDGKTYQLCRKSKEYELLIDVIESYQDALNDDWMPYQIQGLELSKARAFAAGVKEIVTNFGPNDFQCEMIALHKSIRQNKGEPADGGNG